jgi:hypothetical protein
MEIRFSAEKVEITPETYNRIGVIVETEFEGEILEKIGMEKAIDHFDKNKILDEIGVDYVKEHFGLIDEPED